jgi:outer membrane lipoprotein
MAMRNILRLFLIALLLFAASGCAYPIAEKYREEAAKDLTFPMVFRDPTAYRGRTVLWGGEIIETTNLQEGTEILILETPLDRRGFPDDAKYSQGRFVAKSPEFLDPAIYKKGMKVTLAGEISGKETRPLGKTSYTYPVVMIKQLYLWNVERWAAYPYYRAYPYWYGPWYTPWYPSR